MLQVGFNITLESHHTNHANSNLFIKPYSSELGTELPYIDKIKKELSVFYARLKNQYKFKYQTVFSARFDKQDEDNQVSVEAGFFNSLNTNHSLTETNLDNIDNKSPLEHQIQAQKTKDSGWIFDKINSMTINSYKKVN